MLPDGIAQARFAPHPRLVARAHVRTGSRGAPAARPARRDRRTRDRRLSSRRSSLRDRSGPRRSRRRRFRSAHSRFPDCRRSASGRASCRNRPTWRNPYRSAVTWLSRGPGANVEADILSDPTGPAPCPSSGARRARRARIPRALDRLGQSVEPCAEEEGHRAGQRAAGAVRAPRVDPLALPAGDIVGLRSGRRRARRPPRARP